LAAAVETKEPPVDDDQHEHDLGLAHDVSTLLGRRRALQWMGAAGIVALAAACGSNDKAGSSAGSTSRSSNATSATTSPSSSAAAGASTAAIPEETAGPFPADGSNGPNVLLESGIVRRDIRSSFGSSSGTAAGVPLTITLTVLDAGTGGALSGAAVYLWHCDRDGRYSLYSPGATDQNYLRGVQVADNNGVLSFTSIYPGCYSGRWPHIHFEVYPSLDDATKAGTPTATSQIALPKDTCDVVYATDGYDASVSNLSRVSLTTDNVFSDGYSQELATMSGSVADGLVATLSVPV
jgi:protocatechuate 3,4-dioxygenase beta subunit